MTLFMCRAYCWYSASWWWHFVYVGPIVGILFLGDDTFYMQGLLLIFCFLVMTLCILLIFCFLVMTLCMCRAYCWYSASWWWQFVYVELIADILLPGDDILYGYGLLLIFCFLVLTLCRGRVYCRYFLYNGFSLNAKGTYGFTYICLPNPVGGWESEQWGGGTDRRRTHAASSMTISTILRFHR